MNTQVNISSHVQGDVSCYVRKTHVDSQYVEFEFMAFSNNWPEFDIVFEYRRDHLETWRDDASMTETTANYLKGNKLYGITASQYGIQHLIKWKYSDNNLSFGNTVEVRISILPRVRVFSYANSACTISSMYGDSLVNLDEISDHNCIGIDHDGNYMCIGDSVFYVLSSLDIEGLSTSSSSSSL